VFIKQVGLKNTIDTVAGEWEGGGAVAQMLSALPFDI
jgi:hypothetical protein